MILEYEQFKLQMTHQVTAFKALHESRVAQYKTFSSDNIWGNENADTKPLPPYTSAPLTVYMSANAPRPY